MKKILLLFHDYFVLDLVAYTGVQFFNILSLEVGNNVNINSSTIIDSSNNLTIENRVMIGHEVITKACLEKNTIYGVISAKLIKFRYCNE